LHERKLAIGPVDGVDYVGSNLAVNVENNPGGFVDAAV
jgi:hypothetical protein